MFSFLSTYLENLSCCLNNETRNKILPDIKEKNIDNKINHHNIKLNIKKI